MVVAICDDDSIFRKSLKDILLQYKKQKNYEIVIYQFENGTDFLQSPYTFDMVFMDYQMPGLNGLETANELRKRNHLCSIVFITSFPEFVLDSFSVQPLRFITKPIDKNKILEALDAYIQQQKLFYPILLIDNGELTTIASQDITHLQGDGKYCWIYTEHNIYHTCRTLKQTQALLPPHGFCRVHKSFVVNLLCVTSFKDNQLTLTTDKQIPVSKAHITDYKRAQLAFFKDHFVRL